ncbi:hypothetical protein V2J09_017515, partial [Rumex salicifolius]
FPNVVVIGARIIGLTIARQFLVYSDLSVAVVDASMPCSGATGAGQGYIWMAHKTPGVGLEENSLLVGRNSNDSAALEKRVEQLSAAGLHAEYLSSSQLQHKEPQLSAGLDSCAAFLPDDAQIDTQRTINYIQKENKAFASQGRYAEFFGDPAVRLIRSHVTGKIEGVKTKKITLHTRKAVVVAAGCWTGSLMQELIQDLDAVVKVLYSLERVFSL